MDLSDEVWTIILKWDNLAKWSIGKQYIESVDSISVNIVEGWGRYHKKDKIKFYHYSFGSLEESKCWTLKASRRGLLSEAETFHINKELDKLPKLINQLIQFINRNLKY